VISQSLIAWQKKYGRHDLPWQQEVTPYRVWVSEIMLQQTQVETVKNYFLRFMQSFPTLRDLALASEEQVLQRWTGLGYYARARHLHRAAQIIWQQHQGEFPNTLDALIQLPGIGRSTAGAILSLGMQQHAVILDGNVKRVMLRLHAMKHYATDPKIQNNLWDLATQYTPKKNAAIYNQALMDLGAMVCTRRKPQCMNCPLQSYCQAFEKNCQDHIPCAKPKKQLPERDGVMSIIWDKKKECILLEKRPSKGIWGGLWCFPEIPSTTKGKVLATSSHTFTHYRWHIALISPVHKVSQSLQHEYVWYNIHTLSPLALAAVVKRFLQQRMNQ
jgi:A/G-specific adenine glycosylase